MSCVVEYVNEGAELVQGHRSWIETYLTLLIDGYYRIRFLAGVFLQMTPLLPIYILEMTHEDFCQSDPIR
jgi:hypothetical protein